MKNQTQKCSSKIHKEINGIYYCPECKIYMCNKCENHHSELFQNDHHQFKLDKDIKQIFTGFCQEENHLEKLEYFCKTHNQLCCASCIAKIKKKGKSQHIDCDVCLIEDIKLEKKNKLDENIKNLEELSNSLDNSVNKLKEIIDKINELKDNLKIKIQKVFTNIRNALNEREDILLVEVEKKFEIFINYDIIKKSEKLPSKIKLSLEKGKAINKEWNDDNKLNSLINDCISIENNIKDINLINKNIKQCNNFNKIEIKFFPEEENEINQFLATIKSFGKLDYENDDRIKNLNSVIIDNNKDYNKSLKNWINSTKKINAELLYRLSKNGEELSKFHELCDNKSPILILFHVKEGNHKVGIYTSLSLDNNSKWKHDNETETFIFNLNKNKKFKKIKKGYSLYCYKSYGPYTYGFGNEGNIKSLVLYAGSICNYYENGDEILPNEKETKYYEVIEVEVFRIIIE